jgi:hypothetical protein
MRRLHHIARRVRVKSLNPGHSHQSQLVRRVRLCGGERGGNGLNRRVPPPLTCSGNEKAGCDLPPRGTTEAQAYEANIILLSTRR